MSEERGHAHETQALERTQSEESIIGDFAKFGAANRFNQMVSHGFESNYYHTISDKESPYRQGLAV